MPEKAQKTGNVTPHMYSPRELPTLTQGTFPPQHEGFYDAAVLPGLRAAWGCQAMTGDPWGPWVPPDCRRGPGQEMSMGGGKPHRRGAKFCLTNADVLIVHNAICRLSALWSSHPGSLLPQGGDPPPQDPFQKSVLFASVCPTSPHIASSGLGRCLALAPPAI